MLLTKTFFCGALPNDVQAAGPQKFDMNAQPFASLRFINGWKKVFRHLITPYG